MSKFELRCGHCGLDVRAGSLEYRCRSCSRQLDVVYHDRPAARPEHRGMWRYLDRLPLSDPANAVSLGEGGTPLVDLRQVRKRLGVVSASLKAEHLNPTGSFKDRIASVALSIVVERGLAGCVGTSSGNGGAAVAAYAARAGRPAYLFVVMGTADVKLMQILAAGAVVRSVRGLGYDADGTRRAAGWIAASAADRRLFPFLTGGLYSPEAMEGAKTIAFELVEAAPATTAVYVPVGGGGLLSSIGAGYRQAAGWLGASSPRIVAVQPEGCPTVRDALAGGEGRLTRPASTSISGLQVAALFDGRVPEVLRSSAGHLVEVSDEEVWAAQRLLAREEGVLVEPAGATALAGALADARGGRLGPTDQVVVIATGAGPKDVVALQRLTAGIEVPEVHVDAIPDVLATGAAVGRS